MPAAEINQRIAWVDYAKGICIILVVLMHSTLGVEKASGEMGWLHGFIEWARPFRMPDFFLISGLFLAARIDRPWRQYLDAKLLHFAYFYVLWMTIQFGMKSTGLVAHEGFLAALEAYGACLVQPFGTLWFIYLLAVFFIVTKLTRFLPPIVVFVLAAVLEMAPIETGSLVVDEFAGRFVYFFAGFWLARYVFAFAREVDSLNPLGIMGGLIAWGGVNGILVSSGAAVLPGMSLALGFIGAAAVISCAVLLTRLRIAGPIRHCGAHSLVIYLAFFVFMAASRSLLLKTGAIADISVVSLIVTFAGVTGPLLLYALVRRTSLSFLFVRPPWARLAERPAPLPELVSSKLGRLEA